MDSPLNDTKINIPARVRDAEFIERSPIKHGKLEITSAARSLRSCKRLQMTGCDAAVYPEQTQPGEAGAHIVGDERKQQ